MKIQTFDNDSNSIIERDLTAEELEMAIAKNLAAGYIYDSESDTFIKEQS